MDKTVDSIDNAYQEFVKGVAELLEARQTDGGENSANSAIENLAHKWESFKVACDNAEMFINYAKQRITCKSGVDVGSYEDLVVDNEGFDTNLENDEIVNDNVCMKTDEDYNDDDNKKVDVCMKTDEDHYDDNKKVDVCMKTVEDQDDDNKKVDVCMKTDEENNDDDNKKVVEEDYKEKGVEEDDTVKEIDDQL